MVLAVWRVVSVLNSLSCARSHRLDTIPPKLRVARVMAVKVAVRMILRSSGLPLGSNDDALRMVLMTPLIFRRVQSEMVRRARAAPALEPAAMEPVKMRRIPMVIRRGWVGFFEPFWSS